MAMTSPQGCPPETGDWKDPYDGVYNTANEPEDGGHHVTADLLARKLSARQVQMMVRTCPLSNRYNAEVPLVSIPVCMQQLKIDDRTVL
jgi:hypothetical protein